jgi:ADP-ribosyl-[dinitrogen reductase] hydrolase
MQNAQKIFGSILGGAIGDCLGGPYEGSHGPVTVDYRHHWRLSDDTLLTLATCEAISSCGIVSPAAIADVFATWFRKSRFVGLGASTYKALFELSHGGHWALVGRKGEMAAGNGAAMRVAPMAFVLDPKDAAARVLIRDVSRITHQNEEAYAGALAVSLAVRAAWEGTWAGERDLIELVVKNLPDTNVRDRMVQLTSAASTCSLRDLARDFGCSGYVVESVPLALFGAQQIGSLGFRSMLEELVSCGGDTDTIGSIAGQVAGALVGRQGLPEEMLGKIPELGMITKIADEFAASVIRAV